MRSLIQFALAFVLIGVCVVGGEDNGNSDDRMPYTDFLFAAGDRLDCYFTIETWWHSEKNPSCFNGLRIRDEKLASVDALIAKLKRDIPGSNIVRDKDNRRIIHLIEKGLFKQEDYVIEKETALEYSGALQDLPTALGKVEPRIGRCDSASGSDLQNDVVTTVKVHLDKEKVRKILGDAVPIQDYRRILWVGKTLIQMDGRSITQITYVGQKETTASAQNDGAVVEISLPAKCTFGRPLPATVVIRNNGNKPFFCFEVSGLPNDRMAMKLENRDTNEPVDMTPYGKNFMRNITRGGQSGFAKLEKGKSRTWRINLHEFFAPEPGRYRFTASFALHRNGEHDISINVDNLDFTVSK